MRKVVIICKILCFDLISEGISIPRMSIAFKKLILVTYKFFLYGTIIGELTNFGFDSEDDDEILPFYGRISFRDVPNNRSPVQCKLCLPIKNTGKTKCDIEQQVLTKVQRENSTCLQLLN